jgi:hypothetical protein
MPLTLIAQVKTASGLSAFIAPHTHRVSCNGGGAFSQRGTVTAPRGTGPPAIHPLRAPAVHQAALLPEGPITDALLEKAKGYETEIP